MIRILGLALLLLVSGCQERNIYENPNSPTPLPAPGNPSPTPISTSKIEFRVSGNATTVRVRFTNAVDGTSQVITTVPYITTITTQESTMFLSLEATPVTYNFVSFPFMSVQIFANGVLFREAVSSDFFSTLSVSGTWRK